jgi:hypothetical protein
LSPKHWGFNHSWYVLLPEKISLSSVTVKALSLTKVHIGKHLDDEFPIQNDPKQDGSFITTVNVALIFASVYVIWKAQEPRGRSEVKAETSASVLCWLF